MLGYLTWASVLTASDLYIKSGIENTDDSVLPYEVPGTGGRVVLRKNHNPGLVMGLIKKHPTAAKAIPSAVFAAFSVFWLGLMSIKGHVAEKTAATFILSGGAGNLIDRLMRGYVVDWCNIKIGPLKHLVFNLADVFVAVGGFIYVLTLPFGFLARLIMKH